MDWAKKEAFFSAKVPFEEMESPQIGRFKVYGLTVGEKDEFENTTLKLEGKRTFRLANARAQLMLNCVRDKNGVRLFDEADMGRLLAMPALTAEPIIDCARRLSGMNAGELEELVKNSPTDPGPKSGDSATG
jgi:hypothetical protein